MLGGAALVALLLQILPDGAPGQVKCERSDLGCLLNVNQGALSVIALFVAAITGFVAYRDYASGRLEHERERMRAEERFSSVYFDALYEAIHNLFHIATAFGNPAGGAVALERWPEYDLRYAAKLLEPPNSDYLNPRVLPFVDHMLRNDLYIRRFPDSTAGRAKITPDTGYLAEHALRFLLEAWRCEGTDATEASALFDHLRKAGMIESLTGRGAGIKRYGFRIRLQRSDAEREQIDRGAVLLWWFDDSRTLKAAPLFDELRALGDPPARPQRPAAPPRAPHVQDPSRGASIEPMEGDRANAGHGQTRAAPPPPLGAGDGSEPALASNERRALFWAIGVVGAFVSGCLIIGWNAEAHSPFGAVMVALATLFLVYYLVLVWFGASVERPTGFKLGGRTYLAPDQSSTGRWIENMLGRLSWKVREPLFRLPVLVPLACAAATFVIVDHQAASSDLTKQVEPTIIVIFGLVLAINGLLSRGQAIVDYVGAAITVVVLAAAETVTLIEVSGNRSGQVHWIASAMVFGLVTVLISGIRGANAP